MQTMKPRTVPRGNRELRLAGVLCAIALFAPSGGIAQAADRTAKGTETKPAALRAGIAPVYPPLAFKADGKLQGVEPEFAEALQKDLHQPVKLVELEWNDLIPALVDGRIDIIMSGMSITKQREQSVTFVYPYMATAQMALIRAADYDRLRDQALMKDPGIRVGFQTNTTGEDYARAELSKAELRGFPSLDDGIAALRKGEIDYFIYDAPVVWGIHGQGTKQNADLKGLYRPLTEEQLAWAVRKDDTKLRARLSNIVKRWRLNGFIQSVLDRWLPVRKLTIDPIGDS
jgi:ABC-type amino acid transport substrate-binding protein